MAPIVERLSDPSIWDDHATATELSKNLKHLTSAYNKSIDIQTLLGLMELYIIEYEYEYSNESHKNLQDAINELDAALKECTNTTLFTGQHDDCAAIVTIQAGQGGTDAHDWAAMLLRQYLKYAANKQFSASIQDLQDDTIAGIRSATIHIQGTNAYGLLKNEHGVHRIVRTSEYDASGRRHTSFASVEVLPDISHDISIEIADADIRIDTYRSTGAGGQHVNTTDSAVRITHIPTGIVVTCQNERSQQQNRSKALATLKSKLYQREQEVRVAELHNLNAPSKQIAWGSQIRSYIFHPYTLVKDHRTELEIGDAHSVIDGDLDDLIYANLRKESMNDQILN